MTIQKRFSAPVKCGHCQNKTPMEVGATYSTVRSYENDSSDITWEAGTIYEILACPACEGVTLRSAFWHDGLMDPSELEFTVLYPSGERTLRGLPPKIEKAFQAAQKVRNVDANAYGVLLGRVLEFVCEDRNAVGDNLDAKLKSLADVGEIPNKLVDVAAGLRKLRNIGAHVSLGELTEKELPVLDDLTRAILEYVYSAPHLAKEVEDRLTRLKT
ncbi:MAG TPA: DUF4145 domain-containing protein, partial [Clostridia bacterium]|nr:DUF4145 domain-containing protein [Clostridia bacterium]